MLTELQEQTAKAVVNVFETGRVQGDYGLVTLLPGDSGHLTYGRSQTTLGSGNLFLLISAYCRNDGAALATDLSAFLPRLEAIDLSLDHDFALRGLLRDAGSDPVMQEVQDRFFDRVYWKPAGRAAVTIGVETALGITVVYDSHVHGSWRLIRDRTSDGHGVPNQIGEQVWIGHYVTMRRAWLANHTKEILHKTVYRMDNFQNLIGQEQWALPLPLTVHGVAITEESLSADPVVRASAEIAEDRLLRLRDPFMQGEDVREVQVALAAAGIAVDADGVFGPDTRAAVVTFQQDHQLTPDGIVGSATRSALDL